MIAFYNENDLNGDDSDDYDNDDEDCDDIAPLINLIFLWEAVIVFSAISPQYLPTPSVTSFPLSPIPISTNAVSDPMHVDMDLSTPPHIICGYLLAAGHPMEVYEWGGRSIWGVLELRSTVPTSPHLSGNGLSPWRSSPECTQPFKNTANVMYTSAIQELRVTRT